MLAEAIKYLYQQFILRDVAAYVTPGTILALCVLQLYFRDWAPAVEFIKQIPAYAYVPIYGLLFTIGLGIQRLGEMIMILEEHRGANPQERLGTLQEFHRAVLLGPVTDLQRDYAEALERTRERIDVKRYACGNIALALVIAGTLILIAKFFPNSAGWAILVTGALLVVSLLRAQRYHLKELKIWEDIVTPPDKG